MGALFPVCALIERSALLGNRMDAALWIYTAVELGLATVFFYLSTGSWMNYAIQSVVFGAVLTARAASRVLDASPSARILWPAALAVLTVLVSAYNHIFDTEMQMRGERAAAEKIFAHLQSAPICVLLHRPSGFQPGRRAARPGLRRLALSGLRVAAPGRAPLGMARVDRSDPARSAPSWRRPPRVESRGPAWTFACSATTPTSASARSSSGPGDRRSAAVRADCAVASLSAGFSRCYNRRDSMNEFR